MPGIVGVIARQPAAEFAAVVKTMAACLCHERFYRTGTVAAPELGVAGAWIALEDSFAAGQPFQNETRDITLIFAGECHLDPADRLKLAQSGHDLSGSGGSWLIQRFPGRNRHTRSHSKLLLLP